MITKRHALASLQCPRRSWLMVHEPERAVPVRASEQALRDAGRAIGRLAHALFPGAALVDVSDVTAACARTAAFLADPAVPAILEATVVHDGIAVRADALERLPDGAWGLREVKSGTRVRDVHLDDLAIQRHILRSAGLAIASVELIHVDPEYVRGETIEWTRFFARRDVGADVDARTPNVVRRLAALRDELAGATPPAIEPSPHCTRPYRCEFWSHCTSVLPADWILRFGHVRPERWAELRAAGITRLVDLDDATDVAPHLVRARDALARGAAVVDSGLASALADLGPPADYLDFETISPAVPLYPGTRPYERIPVQWSLHRREGGASTHAEFLADGGGDPRRAFAETLLAYTSVRAHPVLVYSAFESEVLADVALAHPDLAPALETLQARLCDLLPIVRAHVYDARFGGSFSLKAVAPTLVSGFGYDDLRDVRDGAAATLQLARLAAGECDGDEAARLRAALRTYCARDTEALMHLHDALRALADQHGIGRA